MGRAGIKSDVQEWREDGKTPVTVELKQGDLIASNLHRPYVYVSGTDLTFSIGTRNNLFIVNDRPYGKKIESPEDSIPAKLQGHTNITGKSLSHIDHLTSLRELNLSGTVGLRQNVEDRTVQSPSFDGLAYKFICTGLKGRSFDVFHRTRGLRDNRYAV